VCYLLCDILHDTCPKTCHKTYLFEAGSCRGARHIVSPLPEPRPRQDEKQAQTHVRESLAEGVAQLGKVSVHSNLLFGALQGCLHTSGHVPTRSHPPDKRVLKDFVALHALPYNVGRLLSPSPRQQEEALILLPIGTPWRAGGRRTGAAGGGGWCLVSVLGLWRA